MMQFFSSATKHPSEDPQGKSLDPDVEDENLRKEYKYKYFKEEMVAVLKSFDQSKEWADLIRCLQRLNKVLKKYPQFPLIPEKLTVSKRLSQCLNAALPSGVHSKTLETYDEVFKHIKEKRLARDLHIYSAGLITLYPFASMQIKPVILNLFQTYYVPLGKSLLPCLSGLVMSLLSGLEEEGSEIYQRSLRTLDRICEITDKVLFFKSLWKGITSAPKFRVASYNYVNAYLKKNKTIEADSAFFGGSKALVVEAIIRSLQDDSLMVQRGVLELLSVCITLSSSHLDHISMTQILSMALLLLDKKEPSINRRLFQWLFNASEFDKTFFDQVTIPHVLEATRILLDKRRTPLGGAPETIIRISRGINTNETSDEASENGNDIDVDELSQESINTLSDPTKPHRVITCLMERVTDDESNELLSRGICTYVINYFYAYLECKDPSFAAKQEQVIRATHELFSKTFSNHSVWWDTIVQHLRDNTCDDMIVMDTFAIMNNKDDTNIDRRSNLLLEFGSALVNSCNEKDFRKAETRLQSCRELYDSILSQESDEEESPLDPTCIQKLYKSFVECLTTINTHLTPEWAHVHKSTCSMILYMLPNIKLINFSPLMELLYQSCLHDDYRVSAHSINTFIAMQSKCDARQSQSMIKGITQRLWDMLSPQQPECHHEASKLLMELHATHKQLVNQTITNNMIKPQQRTDAYARFALLWNHVGETGEQRRLFDDGLFLMLDSIKSDSSSLKLVGKSWLLSSLNDVNRVMDPLLDTLIDRENLQQPYEPHHHVKKLNSQHHALRQQVVVVPTPPVVQEEEEQEEQEDCDAMGQSDDQSSDEDSDAKPVSQSEVLADHGESIASPSNDSIEPETTTVESPPPQQQQQPIQPRESKIKSPTQTISPSNNNISSPRTKATIRPFDDHRSKYVLSLWQDLLQVAPKRFISTCSQLPLSRDAEMNYKVHVRSYYDTHPGACSLLPKHYHDQSKDYLSCIITTCVYLMESDDQQQQSQQQQQDETELHKSIRVSAVLLLRDVLMGGKHLKSVMEHARALNAVVLKHLNKAVTHDDKVFQVELLACYYAIMSLLDQKQVHSVSSSLNPNVPLHVSMSAPVHSIHDQLDHSNEHTLSSSMFSPATTTTHTTIPQDDSSSQQQQQQPSSHEQEGLIHHDLIPTLLSGLEHADSFLLNYWIDYVISFLPFMHKQLPIYITRIVPHMCMLLRRVIKDKGVDSIHGHACRVLLNGIKHVMNYCTRSSSSSSQEGNNRSIPDMIMQYTTMYSTHQQQQQQTTTTTISKHASSSWRPFGALSDFVKDVFSHEEHLVVKNNHPLQDPTSSFMMQLPDILQTTTCVYQFLRQSNDSLRHVHSLNKSIQDLLDHLLNQWSHYFFISMTVLWGEFHPMSHIHIQHVPHENDDSLFGLLDSLEGSSSPDLIVRHLIDVILSIPSCTPTSLIKTCTAIDLLNQYIQHLHIPCDANTTTNMLTRILFMVNELGTNPPSSQTDPMLLSHMIQTMYLFITKYPNAHDDQKKMKSSLKDQTARLIDASCLCCVREMNHRKSLLTKTLQSSTDDHHKVLSDFIHDPMDHSIQLLTSMTIHDTCVDLMGQVYKHGVDPADRDRVQYVTSGIVSTLCGGVLKHHGLDNAKRMTTCTGLIKTLRKLPNHALKNAKRDIWDAFNEPAFFRTEADSLRDWRVMMHMASGAVTAVPLVPTTTSDKAPLTLSTVTDRVQDMLPGRIADKLTNNMLTNAISTTGTILSDTLAPQDNPLKSATLLFDLLQRFGASPSIFASRDSESVTRAKLMKRVAFLILTGNKDDYMPHYPSILEKMVDSLKMSSGAPVMCSFLLLMRVVICRSSGQHLNLFWPTIVTELIRILGQDYALENNGHREVSVLVEAIKFLDYVFCVMPDVFQIYKWIFVGDTVKEEGASAITFVPFLNRNKQLVDGTHVPCDKRRPLLVEPSFFYNSHNEESVIMEWSARLARHAQLMDTDPGLFGSDWDKSFVDRLLENDFVEFKAEEIILLQQPASAEGTSQKREHDHDFVVIDKVII